MNTIHSGDILVSRPTKPSFVSRAIMAITKAHHSHDAVIAKVSDDLVVGQHEPPAFHLDPFEDCLAQHIAGELDFAVYRYKHIPDPYVFNIEVSAVLRALAQLHVPYDYKAILSMAVSWFVHVTRLPFRNIEWMVYCTEGVKLVFDACEIDLFASIPEQKYYSPIHIERLILNGTLELVEDYGFAKYLEK